MLARFRDSAILDHQLPKGEIGERIIRVSLERRSQVSCAFQNPSLIHQKSAELRAGFGAVWLSPHRFGVVALGRCQIARLCLDQPEVDQRQRLAKIYLCSFQEVLFGVLEPGLVEIDNSQIQMSDWVIGLKAHGLEILLFGLVVSA
jgi:hypothetical protein